MATEALRFDESIEVIRKIIDVFKKLKVKELILDSMELDTVEFAAIVCKHRQKKREIGKVASHRQAGKSIISADQPTQLKIYKAAVPIQDDINAECIDNVTFTTIDKAKKDGDAFVKKYRNAIEECNKEFQRLLKEVEAGDITAKEAIRQYLELPVLKSIPTDEIPKLLDYGRSSRGTLKDPNYQLSLNVAIGRVLFDDDESVERMIIRDIHKNRDELGHEGYAAFCMCIGTGHVDRSTLTDPVRIGDNKCQIEMYEELCIQTDTLGLFSRCYGKDIKAVAEMEVWRKREMASVLDECKEEKEEMICRELKEDRTRHDSFAMLKGTTLSLQVPPEEEEMKDMIIKKLEDQIEAEKARMVRLKEHYARIIETEERLEQEKKEKERQKRKKTLQDISTLLSQNKKKEEKKRLEQAEKRRAEEKRARQEEEKRAREEKQKRDRAKNILEQSTLHIPVVKSSKDARLGLDIKKAEEGSSLEVTSIDSGSLFESSELKAGMMIQSVNKRRFTSFDQGVTLLKEAVGECEIMVFNPLNVSDDDLALVRWHNDELAKKKEYRDSRKNTSTRAEKGGFQKGDRVRVSREEGRVWIVQSIEPGNRVRVQDEADDNDEIIFAHMHNVRYHYQ